MPNREVRHVGRTAAYWRHPADRRRNLGGRPHRRQHRKRARRKADPRPRAPQRLKLPLGFAASPPPARIAAMENDSVRTSGDLTLVEMWIDGKLREISISRQAIEVFLQLPPDRTAAISDEDRREFVRTHLALISATAKDSLHRANAD